MTVWIFHQTVASHLSDLTYLNLFELVIDSSWEMAHRDHSDWSWCMIVFLRSVLSSLDLSIMLCVGQSSECCQPSSLMWSQRSHHLQWIMITDRKVPGPGKLKDIWNKKSMISLGHCIWSWTEFCWCLKIMTYCIICRNVIIRCITFKVYRFHDIKHIFVTSFLY